jgi:hypothetical protein
MYTLARERINGQQRPAGSSSADQPSARSRQWAVKHLSCLRSTTPKRPDPDLMNPQPFRDRRSLPRPRLLDSMLAGTKVPLTLLHAGPGYGKTIALQQFGARMGEAARMVTLTALHRDARNLASALKAGSTAAGLTSEHTGRCLLLDNYDVIATSASANSTLSEFISAMPPDLHLYVATRVKPAFPLGHLRGDRALVEISAQELALTLDEVETFFADILEHPIDQAEARHITSLTEGWVTGLTLLSASAPDTAGLFSTRSEDAPLWAASDYFAEVVLARLPQPTVDFLVRSSILDEMHPELCNQLLGTTTAQETLRDLTDSGMFTVLAGPSRARFRYHRMFRDFLRRQLAQTVSAEGIRALHERAAEVLTAAGEPSVALIHFLQARQPARAAQLLSTIGIGQLEADSLYELELHLNELPGGMMIANPWLLALLGRLKRLRNEFDGALGALSLAQSEFEAHGNAEGRAWVSSEINQVGYRDESYTAAIAQVSEALESSSISALTHAHLSAHLCWMLCEAGPVSSAIRSGETAITSATLIDDAILRARLLGRAHRNLALASLYEGNLDRAFALLDRPHRGSVVDAFDSSWIDVIYSMALTLRGDVAEAEELLIRVLDSSAPYNVTQKRWAHCWYGNLLRARGDYGSAARSHHSAGALALVDDAISQYQQGNARELRLRSRRLASSDIESQSVLRRAGVQLVAALDSVEADPEHSISRLVDAESLLHASGHQLHEMSIAAHRAQTLRQLGLDQEGARVDDVVHGFLFQNHIRNLPWGAEFPTDTPGTASPPEQSTTVFDREFSTAVERCADPLIRETLELAYAQGSLTGSTVSLLRERSLTWREIEVFVLYYLRAGRLLAAGSSLRDRTARTLGISEHTLKSHVTRIRSKLGLPESRDGVLQWVAELGVPNSAAHS